MSGVGGSVRSDVASEAGQTAQTSLLTTLVSAVGSGRAIIDLLRFVLMKLQYPTGYDPSQNRLRGTVAVENGTVTTVTTLSNQTSIGGYPAQNGLISQNYAAWALCVRARIS